MEQSHSNSVGKVTQVGSMPTCMFSVGVCMGVVSPPDLTKVSLVNRVHFLSQVRNVMAGVGMHYRTNT